MCRYIRSMVRAFLWVEGVQAGNDSLIERNRTGIIAILLCIAVGIANVFHASILIIFSVICLFVTPVLLLPPFHHSILVC